MTNLRVYDSFGVLACCVRIIVVVVTIGWIVSGRAMAQNDQQAEFQVGDLIEFDIIGKSQQQEIEGLTANGWCVVQLDFNGSKSSHFVMPDQARLIRTVDGRRSLMLYRAWTDATGKFQTVARVAELSDDEVKLLKKDQKVIALAINKLSHSDQEYLRQLRDSMAPPENPFEVDTRRDVNNPEPKLLASGELPISGSIMKPAREVTLDPVPWKYVPSAASEFPGNKSLELPMPAISRLNGPQMKASLFYSGNRGNFISVYRMNELHNHSQIIIIDSNSAEVVDNFTLPIKYIKSVATSPTRETIATILAPSFPHGGGIVFWKNDQGQLVADRAWQFVSVNQPNWIMANACFFVDDQHLLTIGSHLALWDIDTAACIYSVSNPGSWTMTRDHSHIVFVQKGSLWVMRIRDGEIVGQIAGDQDLIAALSHLDVSPDGRSLVAATGQFLYGYDLQSGKAKFSFDSGEPIVSVSWADDSLLIVNNHRVFEPQLGVVVWDVALGFGLQCFQFGATTWVLADNRVLRLELINDDRRTRIAQITEGLNVQDVQCVGPGCRIALSTQLEILDHQETETIGVLRKKLEELGLVIDQGAALRLEAGIEKGEPSSIIFWNHADPIEGPIRERIRFIPHTCHLKLTWNGEQLWHVSKQYSATPQLRGLRQNEPIHEAVRRLSSPDPAFFNEANIPANLSRLPEHRRPGSSTLNEKGLQ